MTSLSISKWMRVNTRIQPQELILTTPTLCAESSSFRKGVQSSTRLSVMRTWQSKNVSSNFSKKRKRREPECLKHRSAGCLQNRTSKRWRITVRSTWILTRMSATEAKKSQSFCQKNQILELFRKKRSKTLNHRIWGSQDRSLQFPYSSSPWL